MVLFNDTSLLGYAITELSSNVFNNDVLTGLWILIIFLAVGAMFRIVFSVLAALMIPVVVTLSAYGYIPMAAGFVLIMILGTILAFSFWQSR